MKSLVVFAALVAVAFAAVPKRREAAVAQPGSGAYVVNEQPHNNIGLDGYQFRFDLSDGTSKQETSQIEIRGKEDATNRVTGSYEWVDPSGQKYVVTYVADEYGYRADGAHLPVAPVAQ